jgi:hypothetical protein
MPLFEPEPQAPQPPVEYVVAPLKIINARHAGRCPVTGAAAPEGAELTPVAGKWVLATPEVREILTEWPRWHEGRLWTANIANLIGAVAVYRAGITDPRQLHPAGWHQDDNIRRHRAAAVETHRMMSFIGLAPARTDLELEEWVALGFTTGWENPGVGPLFMTAGHTLDEARDLLAGNPLTDELRVVLTVEAALAGWRVDEGGFIDRPGTPQGLMR